MLKLFPGLEKKPLIHVEDHQDLNAICCEAKKQGLDPSIFRSAHGTSCLEYLKSLAACQVYFAPNSSRPLGGLANVDAAAAGCIIVGNRRDLWNPVLLSILPRHADDLLMIFRQDATCMRTTIERKKQEVRLYRFIQSRASRQLLSAIND